MNKNVAEISNQQEFIYVFRKIFEAVRSAKLVEPDLRLNELKKELDKNITIKSAAEKAFVMTSEEVLKQTIGKAIEYILKLLILAA
jgi:hypothetical protein